jgi:dephospho-CoA kinase
MINENENTIVIVGLPASGKTTVADQLAKEFPEYTVFHSDDYMAYGYTESMYELMKDVQSDPNPKKIIEGVQAYRLLRKGVELNNFHADLVITVQTDEVTRLKRYESRPGNKLPRAGFDNNLAKVWDAITEAPNRFNMTKSEIIEEYNRKAKEYNDKIVTEKMRERNAAYGSRPAPDESRISYAARMNAGFEAMIILPNPTPDEKE